MNDYAMNPAALAALARGDFTNALVASTPGGIERQEAEGQRQLASAFRTLPKEMERGPAEAFGFVFGDDADELFVNVTAPDGWAIRPTDHSMHSEIVDEQGRVRGSIFYKAAFYDRRADGRWSCRYRIEPEYTADYDCIAYKAIDTATGETLFSQPVPEGGRDDRYLREDTVEKSVLAKLAERFPDYRDPTAYWSA